MDEQIVLWTKEADGVAGRDDTPMEFTVHPAGRGWLEIHIWPVDQDDNYNVASMRLTKSEWNLLVEKVGVALAEDEDEATDQRQEGE